MKILFTGGGGAGNEAIYFILKDIYDVYFADADINSINPLIPLNHRHTIPMADDPKFTEEVEKICKQLSIDILIPGVDEELVLLSKLKSVDVMLPGINYVNNMLDKYTCNQMLIDLNIDAPATTLISDYKNNHWSHFPCIAKPRSGRGSKDVYVIESAEQVNAYLSLTGINKDDAILQEKIIGVEYTVLVAADSEENLHAIIPVKVNSKKGITISAITEHNIIIEDACKKIHNLIPTKGCYNIQLILTNSGRAIPFEINPRISTTFCMGLKSGIDPIDIYSHKHKLKKLLRYKAGLKLQRYWFNNFG